jgi:hypothetical protein
VVRVTEDGTSSEDVLPIGSGTVVSPYGLILTNWHVVDLAAHREQLQAWEAQAAADGTALTLNLVEDGFLILGSATGDAPEPLYFAELVADDQALDFAVLQITHDAQGRTFESTSLSLPYVPLGNSASVRQGDPIHIFSYPVAGGGTLQYTAGVVSGFSFEEGSNDRAWITTDATISGGSSGGTAVDGQGQLIGVPTQGSQLDCRPGDTNLDGTVDAADVGCIPVGGSIGQLRPVDLARPLLATAGLTAGTLETEAPAVEAAPTPVVPASSADTVPTDPAAATSYIFAEDYCRSGPVYQPGTRIVLVRDVPVAFVRSSSVSGSGPVLSSFYLPYRPFLPRPIPAGTLVEITGPYLENGVCDLWPVRYRIGNGVEKEAYVDEWDLSPEFPNQVPPLPPERQSVTAEMEEFCRSNSNYANGQVMVLAHDAPLFSYRRGYLFEPVGMIPAGTEIEIAGSPVETGVCDMWLVEAPLPSPDYIPPTERSELELAGVPIPDIAYREEIYYTDYIFEPDLQPEGR